MNIKGSINGLCFDSGRVAIADTNAGWNEYPISFHVEFSSPPAVICQLEPCSTCTQANSIDFVGIKGSSVSTTGAICWVHDTSGTGLDYIHWIAIGPC